MKLKYIFVCSLIFMMPFSAYAQSDPNGYAIICNSSCQINVADEQGGSMIATVGQGYVINRIDLVAGQTISLPDNESIVADPDDALKIHSSGNDIPQDASRAIAVPPAVAVGPKGQIVAEPDANADNAQSVTP